MSVEKEEEIKNTRRYADISDRLFACAIDGALITLIMVPISAFILGLAYPQGNPLRIAEKALITEYPELLEARGDFMYYPAVYAKTSQSDPALANQIKNYKILEYSLAFILVGIYFVPLIGRFQATPGKKLIGVKVIDSITGEKISYGQSSIRYFGYFPSLFIAGLGVFWGVFNKQKRCWHDFMADTAVIYDEKRWYKLMFQKIGEKIGIGRK